MVEVGGSSPLAPTTDLFVSLARQSRMGRGFVISRAAFAASRWVILPAG